MFLNIVKNKYFRIWYSLHYELRVKMNMRTMNYYIDESGTLDDYLDENNRYFIMSCCITDSPMDLENKLKDLKDEIEDDPYMLPYMKVFKKDGFHATTNHPDIRTKCYRLFPMLNYRIYSVIIDKKSSVFKEIKSRGNAYYEILYSLLYKRLLSNVEENNILIFEEYNDKPGNHKNKINQQIKKIRQNILNSNSKYTLKIGRAHV